MTFFLLVLESPAQCGMTFFLLDLESGSWNAWMAIFHRPEQRDVSPPHEERDEKVQLLVRSAIYAPERRIEQRCGARALTLHRGRLGVVFWVFFWVFVRFFFCAAAVMRLARRVKAQAVAAVLQRSSTKSHTRWQVYWRTPLR